MTHEKEKPPTPQDPVQALKETTDIGFKVFFDTLAQFRADALAGDADVVDMLADLDSIVHKVQDDFNAALQRIDAKLTELSNSHNALTARVDKITGQDAE